MKKSSDLEAYLRLPLSDKMATFLEEDTVETVPAIETGCPLVDLRDFDSGKVLKFHPSLEVFLYRRDASIRLVDAARQLGPLGFVLEIFEAYRPYQKQKKFYDLVWAETKKRLPDLSDDLIRREVTPFIADPEMSPPHLTGGAVDLRMLDLNREIVDMGTEIHALHEGSHLFAPGLAPAALAHRKVLLLAMLNAGFAPLPSEWWHFTYGDKFWGAFYNRFALFETIRDPERFPFDAAARYSPGA